MPETSKGNSPAARQIGYGRFGRRRVEWWLMTGTSEGDVAVKFVWKRGEGPPRIYWFEAHCAEAGPLDEECRGWGQRWYSRGWRKARYWFYGELSELRRQAKHKKGGAA